MGEGSSFLKMQEFGTPLPTIFLDYTLDYTKVKEEGQETWKSLYLENEKQFFNQIKIILL